MSRSYANVITAIWRDADFRDLNAGAQRVYLMLVTQPNISAAGTLPLTLTRWAGNARDTTLGSLRTELKELEAGRFIVVDEATEELLVRSFIRHDNGYRNSKRRPAIIEAAKDAVSPTVRTFLAAEFARLGLPVNGLGGPPSDPDPSEGDRSASKHSPGIRETDTEDEPPEHLEPDALDSVPVDNEYSQVDSLSIANPISTDGLADSNRVVVTQGPYIDPATHNPQSSSRSSPRRLSRPARVVVEALGCDDDDAQAIADEIDRRHRPERLAGYLRTMAEAGDLAEVLAEVQAARNAPPPTVIEPPCGECGPGRLVELDDGRAARCPTCHPRRQEIAA